MSVVILWLIFLSNLLLSYRYSCKSFTKYFPGKIFLSMKCPLSARTTVTPAGVNAIGSPDRGCLWFFLSSIKLQDIITNSQRHLPFIYFLINYSSSRSYSLRCRQCRKVNPKPLLYIYIYIYIYIVNEQVKLWFRVFQTLGLSLCITYNTI